MSEEEAVKDDRCKQRADISLRGWWRTRAGMQIEYLTHIEWRIAVLK